MSASKRIASIVGALLLVGVPASAQSWTAPRTWTTSELVTSSLLNAHIRDNELVLRSGGISVTSQATGDLLCASSSTQFARLADVATGSVLISGGVGACPSWSSSTAALLGTANTFTATPTPISLVPTTGTNAAQMLLTNTGGTTALGIDSSASSSYGANYATFLSSGSTGGLTLMTTGATPIRFYTNTALRWGVNSAGDLTFGSSNHIALSSGAPALGTGWGSGASITGTDYAFLVVAGSSGTGTSGTITFGHTATNTPMCSLSSNDPTNLYLTSASASGLTIVRNGGANFVNGQFIYVQCSSF